MPNTLSSGQPRSAAAEGADRVPPFGATGEPIGGGGGPSGTLAGVSTLRSTFGREVEIAQLEAAIDARGRLVYVEGHAGIGKSSLLALARAHAEASGARVLSGAGSELEHDYGYGVARQLLAEAASAALLTPASPADAASETPAAPNDTATLAATALGLATAEPAPVSPDSPFPVLDALYRLTAALAAARPLVLLLDDAHWADAPTLRLVDFLAARLDGLALTLVVAARPAEPAAPSELLQRLRDRRETVLVRPAPLDARAAAALLRERWDARRPPPSPSPAATPAAATRSCCTS